MNAEQATSPETATSPLVYRGPDRRRSPTPRFSRYSLWGGRRRGPRRGEECEGSFVDVYGTRLILAVLWIALMNVGDSFFTLVHLQAGGVKVELPGGIFPMYAWGGDLDAAIRGGRSVQSRQRWQGAFILPPAQPSL